jgi:hypothetical protein
MRGSQLMAKCRQDQQSGRPWVAGLGLFFTEVVDIDPPGHEEAEGPQEDVAHHCRHVDVWPVDPHACKGHEDERNGKNQVDANGAADRANGLHALRAVGRFGLGCSNGGACFHGGLAIHEDKCRRRLG